MNYLAHLYLSFGHDEIALGNFIADGLKRTEFDRYPNGVRTGIELHHHIDNFTDSHPLTLQSKARLQPEFRKYSPVVADIFYDHFLASHWKDYHPEPLEDFAFRHYELFREHWEVLPPKVQYMLPYMERHNWLVNYAHPEGLDLVFQGMNRRARFASGMDGAVPHLLDNYEEYREEFRNFFPQLLASCKAFLANNSNRHED